MKPRTTTVAALVLAAALAGCQFPFERLEGPPAGTGAAAAQNPVETAERLRKHVESLATTIGQRSYLSPEGLRAAAALVEAEFAAIARRVGADRVQTSSPPSVPGRISRQELEEKQGRQRVCAQRWNAEDLRFPDGTFRNIELTVRGRGDAAREEIVVGAHYDTDACESEGYTPGADDNASGVAALIELASRIGDRSAARDAGYPQRTLRFVAFTNEEEPFFWTAEMGSRKYACDLKKRTDEAGHSVLAMLSLETMGYFSDEPDSQHAPWYARLFLDLPRVGDFIAVVTSPSSRPLAQHLRDRLPLHSTIPVEGFIGPESADGIGWSDHSSFWPLGVPAVMVTDTALQRNGCYHEACDRPDGRNGLNYGKLARVIDALESTLIELATPSDHDAAILRPYASTDCRTARD